jgi:cytochrome b6-f complex iron-sulfur subunit
MQRRWFLAWLGLGGLISWVLAACGQGNKTQAVARTDGFTALGSVKDLDAKGFLKVDQSANPILVVRSPKDANALLAVNPTCTHQGCLVEWKAERKAYACPCHGGNFSAEGSVVSGPPPKPLKTYEAKIENDQVLVKV